MRWRRIHLAAGIALLAISAGAVDVVVSQGPVVPGEWNANLSAVLETAHREHLPVLIVLVSQGCPICARLNNAIDGEAFSQWQRNRKLLMAYIRASSQDVAYKQTRNFIKSVAPGDLPEFPSVCVYWPKADGTTNSVAFAGRRGEMGTERKELLSVEFMTAVDQVLKEYLAQDPKKKYLAIEQIVANSTKTISCAKAGAEGTVTMRPESGIFSEGEKVLLEARAASDALFVGWEDPNGRIVEWNYRLVVSGRMPAGTYTARFRAKKGCPPPVLTVVSTSLVEKVGNRFTYSIPVAPSCRPVHFRTVQRLPKGLKLDKVSGELSGSFRKEGDMHMTISVVGSDEASTIRSHSIDWKILPKGNKAASPDGAGEKR